MPEGILTIPLEGPTTNAGGCGVPDGGSPALGDFVVGPENPLIAAAIDEFVAALASGRTTKFNPLVLYGPTGSGKSHLARGVAQCCREGFGRGSVVCRAAVEFAQAWREAMEIEAVDQWRDDLRRSRLLVIEDLQQLSQKAPAQEELARTCDAILQDDGHVLMTLRQHPSEARGLIPALSARLAAGLAVPLALPAMDTRRAILSRVATARSVELTDEALVALAEGLTGSARELTGAVVQLQMTVPGRVELQDVDRWLCGAATRRSPTLREIASQTARRFSLKVVDLRSHSRGKTLVAARGVAMLLARRMTGHSLRRIGDYFGGRDHTTVMHACRRAEELARTDIQFEQTINDLHASLTSH